MSVAIVEYDPQWPRIFEAEARRVGDALDGVALRIEHVGSTAVPGLAAKPVIDIQVSVADLEPLESYRLPLESLDYLYATVPIPFFHKPEGWPHTHHVHVREAGSDQELHNLAFRDWLRANPEDRDAYEALKRDLARGADLGTVEARSHYSEAKTDFIQEIVRRSRNGAR